MKNTLLSSKWLTMMAMVLLIQVVSCKKDDPIPEVIASFTFTVDAADFKKITFTNASQNFATSSWDFGDASAKSTDANPVHTFPAAGDFNVVLTVTNADGKTKDAKTVKVTVSDPNAQLTMLVGDVSKTWKLLRDASKKQYPAYVGPLKADGTRDVSAYYGMGRGNDDIAIRSCMFNHEYTFTRAGLTFKRDLKGSMWGEGSGTGGVFLKANNGKCFDTTVPANMKTDAGDDLSVWGNFTGTFSLTAGTTPTLKVTGLGAYMALEKVGTDLEVKTPQASVTYTILKLTDATAGTDSLIIEARYKFNAANAKPDAYWQFAFVHYDNAASEPPIPSQKPQASFTAVQTGNSVAFTNTSLFGVTYNWDFGDGTTSSATSPSHTYANDGIFNVSVKASNSAGDNTSGTKFYVVNTANLTLTDAVLQGLPWRVQADNNSVFVGPGFGKNDYFAVPKTDLIAGGSWACMTNDEFKFSTGGVFGYDTKGDVRNDGYMDGFANGCITDAQLATVVNDGKRFKTEAAHSYVLDPAAGANRATITVTNGGANNAVAFLGFYKPYNGGENSDKTKAANGGKTSSKYEVMAYVKNTATNKEYLFVSIDYTVAQAGAQAWSVVLVR